MTRKRAKRPSTAVRKGRLAVYCIASELQVCIYRALPLPCLVVSC